MAMLAVAPEGELRRLPDMYMRTIAVGPRARDVIDLDRPVADNVQRVAESFGRQPLTSQPSSSTGPGTTT